MERRCPWCIGNDLNVIYHDREWGVPSHDDVHLFEMLTLEGAQAGLSWLTILKKRDNYRLAFEQFDPAKVASYSSRKVTQLLSDPGIVRNRLKILSTIQNAKAFIAVQEEFGSFDQFVWQFVDGVPLQSRRRSTKELPAKTKHSDAMSKELLRRNFKFVGSTICYAFMQAVGMVNDHLINCFRYSELQGHPSRIRKPRAGDEKVVNLRK